MTRAEAIDFVEKLKDECRSHKHCGTCPLSRENGSECMINTAYAATPLSWRICV